MAGVLDRDLLTFAQAVTAQLPGDVQVGSFSLQRREDAGPELLARLRAGEQVDVVHRPAGDRMARAAPTRCAAAVMIHRGLRPAVTAAMLLTASVGLATAEQPPAPRKTAGDSLLFSAEALALIESARRGERAVPKAAATGTAWRPTLPAVLHLSAIVWHAPDDWRIWLNGESFTPADAPGPVEVVRVTPDAVRLAWHADPAGPPHRFELRPNQSYLIASGRVVEGRRPARGARVVGGSRR